MTVDIRPATADDRPEINALLRDVLGAGEEPRYDRFLDWKHRAGPFGPSYEWVATIGSTIAGYRCFLRWQFVVDGNVRDAVRAVDTATHAEHRGQGVFTALTTHALDELRSDGVMCVFNTPNPISEAGYVKMGWSIVGTVPVSVFVRNPLVLRHLRRSRPPADRLSEPVDAFEPALAAIAHVGESPPDPTGRWSTNRTPAFLRWRYGFEDLHYRAMASSGGSGFVIFRVRRRGAMREVVIADLLGSANPRPQVSRADVRRILRATGADVAITTGTLRPRGGFSIHGPRLAWRPLSDDRVPTLDQLALCGGDLELF